MRVVALSRSLILISRVRLTPYVMSGGYGGRTGGSFVRRGSSSKKVRRRRQDYHKHRVRSSTAEAEMDLQTLKERTLQSLNRLGHQTFQPGSGYDMESWVKSLGILLDDFEAKATASLKLSSGYLESKGEVLSSLSKAPELPEMDSAIAAAKDEEQKVLSGLGDLNASYFGSKLGPLRSRRMKLTSDLDEEQASIARIKAESRPGGFLSRILGQRPPSTTENEAHVAGLQVELDDVSAKIASLEEEESRYREGKKALSLAVGKVADLETAKTVRLQLAPEREEATRRLAEEISKMLSPPPSSSS